MNRFSIPRYSVIKYIRDKKGNPRGCIVAVKLGDGNVSVHYSYCNSKLDRFVKSTALKIAFGRAFSNKGEYKPPRDVIREIDQFNERVCRYFKVKETDLYTFWSGDEFDRPGEDNKDDLYWNSEYRKLIKE